MEYDEDIAIQYIRDHVSPAMLEGFDDDMLLEIIDIIWDYYDSHGMLDISLDDDDDDEVDLDAMTSYAVKLLRKSYPSLGRSRESGEQLKDTVRAIIEAEIEYEDTLED